MNINTICILLSSLSFYAYVVSYFVLPKMKEEFKRFGLEKLGLLTIILELFGATGLILGLFFKPLLIAASLGLSLLMFAALIVRMRLKDNLWISLPAIAYLCLNGYIFWTSIR